MTEETGKASIPVEHIVMPPGWIVWELGQELGFHLWHCCLIQNPVTGGKERGVVQVIEKDSMAEALTAAVELARAYQA